MGQSPVSRRMAGIFISESRAVGGSCLLSFASVSKYRDWSPCPHRGEVGRGRLEGCRTPQPDRLACMRLSSMHLARQLCNAFPPSRHWLNRQPFPLRAFAVIGAVIRDAFSARRLLDGRQLKAARPGGLVVSSSRVPDPAGLPCSWRSRAAGGVWKSEYRHHAYRECVHYLSTPNCSFCRIKSDEVLQTVTSILSIGLKERPSCGGAA